MPPTYRVNLLSRSRRGRSSRPGATRPRSSSSRRGRATAWRSGRCWRRRSPPNATSTASVPSPSTSSCASTWSAKHGTLLGRLHDDEPGAAHPGRTPSSVNVGASCTAYLFSNERWTQRVSYRVQYSFVFSFTVRTSRPAASGTFRFPTEALWRNGAAASSRTSSPGPATKESPARRASFS
jgi:hypothetical protein